MPYLSSVLSLFSYLPFAGVRLYRTIGIPTVIMAINDLAIICASIKRITSLFQSTNGHAIDDHGSIYQVARTVVLQPASF
jgi:hypothetical protein